MSRTFLRGIALRNFRGIGNEFIRLAPFRELNFFVGPNNAGKSTVLHFLANYLHSAKANSDQWTRSYEPIDVRLGSSAGHVGFQIAIDTSDLTEKLYESVDQSHRGLIGNIVQYFDKDGLIWLEPTGDGRQLFFADYPDVKTFEAMGLEWEWQRFWSALTSRSQGSLHQHWIPQSLDRLGAIAAARVLAPPSKFIPAIREISGPGHEFQDLSGRGLIERLAELQNPAHHERHKRRSFNDINEFLRDVTDSPEAQIEIPHDRGYVMVHMDNKALPLSSLGTGIHEVVMLASFCTLVENQIVCVEEPEIHLHPIIQRKLIRYLAQKTSNQYFVATHSASLIDAAPASIFKVENRNGETNIRLAVTSTERHEVCHLLGYQASDILQSNFIIWVEGPSDRIYLKSWISALDPTLTEGIEYSIMFYGGRLLAHLSANDPEVSGFISLRRLNRNMAVVIDSDKRTSHSPISETKKRVQAELGQDACWITAGREIENYVPPTIIGSALKAVYPARFASIRNTDRYAHRLHFVDVSGHVVTEVDKVKVATAAIGFPVDLTELDLQKRVKGLVALIRQANHVKTQTTQPA